jgi:hypothetical protein
MLNVVRLALALAIALPSFTSFATTNLTAKQRAIADRKVKLCRVLVDMRLPPRDAGTPWDRAYENKRVEADILCIAGVLDPTPGPRYCYDVDPPRVVLPGDGSCP